MGTFDMFVQLAILGWVGRRMVVWERGRAGVGMWVMLGGMILMVVTMGTMTAPLAVVSMWAMTGGMAAMVWPHRNDRTAESTGAAGSGESAPTMPGPREPGPGPSRPSPWA